MREDGITVRYRDGRVVEYRVAAGRPDADRIYHLTGDGWLRIGLQTAEGNAGTSRLLPLVEIPIELVRRVDTMRSAPWETPEIHPVEHFLEAIER